MTVRVYRSTDAGASALTLTNVAGKFIALLDAVLVNGYSVGTVSSITRVGSVATVLFSAAHGLAEYGNMITVAGSDQTEYNGEHEMIWVSTTEMSFTVTGTPATPATGTITATKAGAGWTKPYSGTNLAAYLQGAGSNGFYFRVDDTTTTYARVVGYETMSDIDTGIGDFPTAAQQSGGLYWSKSNSSTARDWIITATESAVHFWVNYTGTITSAPWYFFGDGISDKSVDDYFTMLLGGTNSTFNTGNMAQVNSGNMSSATSGSFCARSHSQSGGSITIGKAIDATRSNNTTSAGSNGESYPSNVTGGLHLCNITICENTIQEVRGLIPGIIVPLHNRPLTDLDTFDGTGDFLGKKYLALTTYNSGQCFMEISNTW